MVIPTTARVAAALVPATAATWASTTTALAPAAALVTATTKSWLTALVSAAEGAVTASR